MNKLNNIIGFKVGLILSICIYSTVIVSAQADDCINYPEIEGQECVSCIIEGWEPLPFTSPDMLEADGFWDGSTCLVEGIDGESPSGGNMSIFFAVNGYLEGMQTVVEDLDPEIEYVFGLWWQGVTMENCWIYSEGDLLVVIDEVEYEFSGATDWELIEICFTPSSSSVEIELMIQGEGLHLLVVDNATCEDLTPCCALVLELDEDEAILCPGEEFVFPGEYYNEEGQVNIEWSSDPPDGIDFLDDIYSLNPTFEVTNTESFEGAEYIFLLEVEDDNCKRKKEFYLEVRPSIVPDFDITLCEVSEELELPLESDDGFSGSWEGETDLSFQGGATLEYIFTLDPGQDNCIEQWTYYFPVNSAIELSFDLDTEYCVSDNRNYTLPDRSNENYRGLWDFSNFNPSDLNAGTYDFIFTADFDEYCAFPFELEITILAVDTLSFDLPLSFCASLDTFYLPKVSNELVSGYWVPEYVLPSDNEDSIAIFYPESNLACYGLYEYTYSVNNNVTVNFNLDSTICSTYGLFAPDKFSTEGYEGVWTPSEILIDTISIDSFIVNWTPIDDYDGCLMDTNIVIHILSEGNLVFNLPETLCVSELPYSLPLISNNGLPGTWNIPNIDPQTQGAGYINLMFTTNSIECSENYIDSILIVESEVPVFSFDNLLCANADVFLLPVVSDNNISGTWSSPSVDASMIVDSLELSFVPDPAFSNCADSVTVSFYISDLVDPIFSLPDHFCVSDGVFNFPSQSMNGISGQWLSSSFDPQANQGMSIFSNTFVPDDLDCYSAVDASFAIVDFSNIDLNNSQPTTCSSVDGELTIGGNGFEIEYSLDLGNTWNVGTELTSLPSGSYDLWIRSLEFNSCIEMYSFDLMSPSLPVLVDIQTQDISGCNASDGVVNVMAEGSSLEYSIDGGSSWQLNSEFELLEAGIYELIVRSLGDNMCSDTGSFEIIDFPITSILDIEIQPLTDCGKNDASILIMASGQDLEYSIDGTNWQRENEFDNLSAGTITAQVRSSDDEDCLDSADILIDGIVVPQIEDLFVTSPSDCGIEDGLVEVVVNGMVSAEFSIDGGNSWQTDNRIENLASGDYRVLVRLQDFPSCIEESFFTVPFVSLPQIVMSQVVQPSDCQTDDAYAIVEIDAVNSEYSIDDGLTWQEENEFGNLLPGSYEIIARDAERINCELRYTFEIISPPCPCNVLDVSYTTIVVDCLNPTSGGISIETISGTFTGETPSITWEGGQSGLELNNLSEGWYVYEISYDRNCKQEDSIYVESIDPLDFDLLAFDQDCKELGSIVVTNLTGGSGEPQYSLNGLEYQTEGAFVNLTAQEYEIIVQDLFNCNESETVVINDNSDLQLVLEPITPIQLGEKVVLNPLINESTIDDYEWTPPTGILNPGELIAEVSPTETTEYTLTIYFGDCTEIRSVLVEVIQPKELYVANIMSLSDPNNDRLFIQSGEDNNIVINAFNIYDRWGNLVFKNESLNLNEPQEGWDGYINDKKAEIGVYVYVISYSINEEDKLLYGTVTLIR